MIGKVRICKRIQSKPSKSWPSYFSHPSPLFLIAKLTVKLTISALLERRVVLQLCRQDASSLSSWIAAMWLGWVGLGCTYQLNRVEKLHPAQFVIGWPSTPNGASTFLWAKLDKHHSPKLSLKIGKKLASLAEQVSK